MQEKILKYVKNLQDDVTRAYLSFQIHRFYTNNETRPIYLDTMNMYVNFFATSIHAHFTTMIIELYRIYEKREKGDTYNLPTLISMLKKQKDFPKETLSSVESLYNEAEPLWKNVAMLRNNCFGHVSNKLNTSDYFKKASVSANDIKHLIKLTRQCLNEIQYVFNRSRVAIPRFGESDIEKMMKDLKKYCELRQMSPNEQKKWMGLR